MGRRPLLLLGFGALPLRCLLFAYAPDPALVVVVQLLDGISAAALGVLITALIVADITRDTGHFNLAQGVVGTAVGVGAAVSTLFRRLCQRPLWQRDRIPRSRRRSPLAASSSCSSRCRKPGRDLKARPNAAAARWP